MVFLLDTSSSMISDPPIVLMAPLLPYPLLLLPLGLEYLLGEFFVNHEKTPGNHLLNREYSAGNEAHMMARLVSTVE